MLNIQLSKTVKHSQVVVTFSQVQKKGQKETVSVYPASLQKILSDVIENKTITGKLNESVKFLKFNYEDAQNLSVVGLGSKPTAEQVRSLGATVYNVIHSYKNSHFDILFDGITTAKKEGAVLLQAFVEGMALASYEFKELKTGKKEETKDLQIELVSKIADASYKAAIQNALILTESVNFSRRLGDMPGNLMTPVIFADTVAAEVKGTKLKATIWDKTRIKKEKMGGLLGVSQGSDQEPRFLILEYKGAAAGKAPIAFVGKGLTFDCGGVSIKPSAAMEEMKYDMCGGANVVGAMLAICKLKLKVNVLCFVPMTENMVNGSATKPGDVHTARNGKTFEINNTDAEGRLILADALAYASEQKPQIIIDAATLTGAIVMALGNIHTGYFTRNQALKAKIEKAATVSGEMVWNMPLTDFHAGDMKGEYADLSNTSNSKGAGSATAAAFLEQFVDSEIPWAHFDIAGTAWSVGNRLNYCPRKGASGAMIRTFVELARQYAK